MTRSAVAGAFNEKNQKITASRSSAVVCRGEGDGGAAAGADEWRMAGAAVGASGARRWRIGAGWRLSWTVGV